MNQVTADKPGGSRPVQVVLLAMTLLVTLCYLTPQVRSGWIPHDEGLLGQTAERVLEGEVPHRDFDDMYSGGLTYLHAAAMKILGTRLSSMRWVLLAASLLAVACWYGIATHFAPPWVAMLVSLLCLSWSTPNYFASLPSWYILLLASASTWMLLQYQRHRQNRWLLAAGFCCGLSLMIKIVGLYMIAAALLSLLAISFQPDASRDRPRPGWPERLLSLAPGILLCLLVLLLVRRHLGREALLLFVLPNIALAMMLVQIQSRSPLGDLRAASALLVRPMALFLSGLLVPISIWIGYYVAASGLGDLVNGIFVMPQARLDSVTSKLPYWFVILWGLPAIVLLWLGLRKHAPQRKQWFVLLAILSTLPVLGNLLEPLTESHGPLLSGLRDAIYQPVFLGCYYLPAVVVISGTLVVRLGGQLATTANTRLFIVLSPVALMTLIQYPYSTGIYFCYYAPLLILGILAVVRSQAAGWQRSWIGIGVVYLLFAIATMNFSFSRSLGGYSQQVDRTGPLSERADLLINQEDLDDYGVLIQLLQELTSPGEAIYATPDCPEVYFLAGRRNPTRTMYDIFDRRDDREQRILEMLEREQVRVVVLNIVPEFSDQNSDSFLSQLEAKFPHTELIGQGLSTYTPRFVVLWR